MRRQATVAAVDPATRTCTIQLAVPLGDDPVSHANIAYLASYIPRINDVVWIDKLDTDWLVIGACTVPDQSGVDTMAVTTAQSQNTKAITFPMQFDAAPRVLLTMQDSLFRVVIRVGTGTLTTSGFTVNIATADGTNFGSNQTLTFAWEAVRP